MNKSTVYRERAYSLTSEEAQHYETRHSLAWHYLARSTFAHGSQTVSHVREAPPNLGKPKIRYKMITAERGEMRDSVACCIMHMERSVISNKRRANNNADSAPITNSKLPRRETDSRHAPRLTAPFGTSTRGPHATAFLREVFTYFAKYIVYI